MAKRKLAEKNRYESNDGREVELIKRKNKREEGVKSKLERQIWWK